MPTITFDNPPTGFFQSYVDTASQFSFTTQRALDMPNITDVLTNASAVMPEPSGGGYLSNQYSQDTVVVSYAGGANTFGATSINIDGFQELTGQFDSAGNVLRAPTAVTFNFTGVLVNGTEVHFSFSTDDVLGWQSVTLPASFATGLTKLTWTTTNDTNAAWGAFDNVSLVLDSTTAPPPSQTLVAVADTATVKVHDTVLINVMDNDTDAVGVSKGIAAFGGSLATLQSGLTAHSALGATLTFQSGQILYSADGASYGNLALGQTVTDTFYYKAVDANGTTSTTSVTVTINNPDHAPVAVADTATVLNGQTVTINAVGNDSDPDAGVGDTISLTGFGATAAAANSFHTTGTTALGASVSLVSGKLVYNANAFSSLAVGQTAVDTFYYTVSDAHGMSSTASVSVTVSNPDHAPVAVGDTATVVNNQAVTIDALHNDSDPDAGDTISLAGFGATAATANGSQTTGTSALGASVSLVDGKFVYTANANLFDSLSGSQTKVDTFYYTVTDSHGVTSTASVNVTVTASAGSAPPPPAQGPEIDGGKHDDNLVGTAKSEVIHGLAGDDTITGAGGDDTLAGGDGNDTFVFGANFGKDVITDFQGGHWDDAHDNRDGDKKANNGHDSHDDDRNWQDGNNSGYGYGNTNDHGNDHGDDRNGHDATWIAGDVIKIATAEFHDYADLLAHATQTSQGVLFTAANGLDTLLLQGASLSSLHSQDFLFG
jgi:hypothetical protein